MLVMNQHENQPRRHTGNHNNHKPTNKGTTITMDISGSCYGQVSSGQGLRCHLREDERRYVDFCERGLIYDHLQDAAGLGGLSRSQVKEKFYREIFFGRNQVVTDFTRLFDREFPLVMRLIRDAKRKDYTRLACQMQTMESSLVINRVCRRLMATPQVPLITIHDSILTTPVHVERVRTAMLGRVSGGRGCTRS